MLKVVISEDKFDKLFEDTLYECKKFIHEDDTLTLKQCLSLISQLTVTLTKLRSNIKCK